MPTELSKAEPGVASSDEAAKLRDCSAAASPVCASTCAMRSGNVSDSAARPNVSVVPCDGCSDIGRATCTTATTGGSVLVSVRVTVLPLTTPYESTGDMSLARVVLPRDSTWTAAGTPVTLSTLAFTDETRSDTDPPRKVRVEPNVLLSEEGRETCTTKGADVDATDK